MSDLAFAKVVSFDRAVSQGLSYDTSVGAEHLPRLGASCEGILEPARAVFRFFRDLQGLRTIEGEITCKVRLRCQRCGGQIETELRSKFRSTCDEAKAKSLRIDDRLDLVAVTAAGDFALLDYLEDCLLLELPFAPRHEDGDPACRAGGEWSFGQIEDKRPNPFAALSALKGELKDSGSR
ncbi:MAG: YceD family protein [Succinivibrio sp.]|jgi:uncharacterized protein|nr:YceD family protein [Succinivibrio sp.]